MGVLGISTGTRNKFPAILRISLQIGDLTAVYSLGIYNHESHGHGCGDQNLVPGYVRL